MAPCSWTVSPLCSTWGSYSADEQAYALRFATFVLWAATGRRYGLCPVTVRPCKPVQEPLYMAFPVVASWGLWVSADAAISSAVAPVGCCAGSCACDAQAMALPGPVGAVTAVVINGVTLDPSAYRLAGSSIIRQDGNAWPTTQDMSAPAGTAGTWSVSYTRGEAVPPPVLDAAGIYACEIARGRAGGSCFLPYKVQSVTRQGTQIEFVDTTDYLNEGLTGVAEVDQLIRMDNPYKLKSRPRVLSLDLPTYQ